MLTVIVNMDIKARFSLGCCFRFTIRKRTMRT